mmetsp:Transcript_26819/g.63612  ORF Transcript_26819/g.63612 Transcript_26819/m.63612 type:complete len:219 (+) Transcript_26819:611-1267(+)
MRGRVYQSCDSSDVRRKALPEAAGERRLEIRQGAAFQVNPGGPMGSRRWQRLLPRDRQRAERFGAEPDDGLRSLHADRAEPHPICHRPPQRHPHPRHPAHGASPPGRHLRNRCGRTRGCGTPRGHRGARHRAHGQRPRPAAPGCRRAVLHHDEPAARAGRVAQQPLAAMQVVCRRFWRRRCLPDREPSRRHGSEGMAGSPPQSADEVGSEVARPCGRR